MMDEIEYKLNTKNSVLVVNAIDKLISTIKSKFKPAERQRFVLENEELKFLREKCSSKDHLTSLTACQGLLALVELGVLEIAYTMSTVVTLIPSAHNYSAIISTMGGLLILDLRSRQIPGQQYKCQFGVRSPQHPFISVLEKNKDAEDDVLAQMHAICTHPDYVVSSNSLELLRPVLFWLTCNPQRDGGIRPWQLLLNLPPTESQSSLLLACLSCQQICNPTLIERSFSAYSAVTDTAIYQKNREMVMALLPMLARISYELIKHGRDPRPCYILIERCFNLDVPELRSVSGLVLMILAENLAFTSALHLHELFNLALNIINRYEHSNISLSVFAAMTLQWLNLPSYLTSSALKIASKILDIYQNSSKDDSRLYMSSLKSNKTFQTLLHTDSHLSIIVKLNQNWEKMKDNPDKLKSWLDCIETVDGSLKLELLPFLLGIIMEKRKEDWFEEIILKSLKISVDLVDYKKDISVHLLPMLLYKIGNDKSPCVKMACLKALPSMAKTKENVPTIVSILNKLKANKGVPTSFLISLYTTLAETQVRCFPYLQELLVDVNLGRPDDLKWELDIARAQAVKKICDIRASSHGLELVSVISSTLNRCGDKSGSTATWLALSSLGELWKAAAVAPPSAWNALQPKLAKDDRPTVNVALCKLLAEVPALRVSNPEYDRLIIDACRKLWSYVAESNHPEVILAACDALSGFKIEDYKLKDIPEIYRRTVKLPASYCKTPADAIRKPEDVLDYIPCEVWPEVFKFTNQTALAGVVSLTTKLIEREIKSYRSGIYQIDARQEPETLSYMPAASVARGLMDFLRKQSTSPSYEYPEAVMLGICEALTAEYPRPLPPMQLSFIPELLHRSSQWRRLGFKLCARQATVSPSARRIVADYLQGVSKEGTQESDILIVFESLPILCRSMPPNSLRPPIERFLGEAFASTPKQKCEDPENLLFVKQLEMIKGCLENYNIHDANRTLLSQLVESYFSLMNDDHVAWPMYVKTCCCMSTKYLERMTSPSGWWELSSDLLRKSTSIRVYLASTEVTNPLVWLNEIIDAQANQLTEQEFSLRSLVSALKAAKPNESSTREWFLQLMARTQVAFQETEEESAKLYLCDVFILSVIVYSGYWSFEPDRNSDRVGNRTQLSAAIATLLHRVGWNECAPQVLEWLCHTRSAVSIDKSIERNCQRALLAARHTPHFAKQHIWTKLESHFGKEIVVE